MDHRVQYPVKNHKDLDVWKKSIDFVAQIYEMSKCFPKEEAYGIQGQIRRAAVSIPANISEGASRNTRREYIQFLYIALGSASEVETHLIVAQRIGFLSATDEALDNVENIKKMLNGLISYLKKK
jgi:four helix bundle protein